ncbi:MAG: radical SAM protein [Myxococcota bacterium]|nr:radical SAM protein [Myxococcota bacterium]
MAININLELTDHCNLKCKMCSQSMRDEAHGVPSKFMAWDTWRTLLHNLSNYPEEIHLCPHWLGEPTIHPQFDMFVEYAFAVNRKNRLFREFKLHTNAVVFSEQRSKLLIQLANLPTMANDTFNFIHFSIDAFSKDTYKTVKGTDKRDIVFRNVANFLRIRSELNFERPFASIAFVVQPENHHEADQFLQYWSKELKRYECGFTIDHDWQKEHKDSIYFRRLNSSEQHLSDKLHADTLIRLGVLSEPPVRMAESF